MDSFLWYQIRFVYVPYVYFSMLFMSDFDTLIDRLKSVAYRRNKESANRNQYCP